MSGGNRCHRVAAGIQPSGCRHFDEIAGSCGLFGSQPLFWNFPTHSLTLRKASCQITPLGWQIDLVTSIPAMWPSVCRNITMACQIEPTDADSDVSQVTVTKRVVG